jgi:hypothetical protein
LIIAVIPSALIDTVSMLNGNNFSEWKENLLFTLGCMELDLALRVDEPPALTDKVRHKRLVNMNGGSDLIA